MASDSKDPSAVESGLYEEGPRHEIPRRLPRADTRADPRRPMMAETFNPAAPCSWCAGGVSNPDTRRSDHVGPAAPEGYATVNPFIITKDAENLTRFIVEVLAGTERPEARTIDDDGLLLQGEVVVGTTTLMLAERKPGWPFTPSLLQVYVDDLEATIERALARGARLITRPTDFFGTAFARIQDPSANIWWLWQHGELVWDQQDDADAWTEDAPSEDWGAVSPELAYIHDTLLEAMSTLRDPVN